MKKFQAEYANEIPTPTGYVGPLTRNIIKTLTCGTVNKTTTTTPTSPVATNYNPNGAWWLAPASTAPGTTPTPGTDPVKNNTTPTPTSTTTPPNCEQYAGVIPGESRKLSVVNSSIPSYAVNTPAYYISSEAQAELDQMHGDIGWPYGGETDVTLSSGNVYVYRFKTTEYNNAIPSYITIRQGSSVTGSTVNNTGAIMMSVSECPADFTSPALLAKKDPYDWTTCVGTGFVNGDSGGANLDVSIRGKWGNGQSACILDENKTYYLNVTAGFSYPGTGDGPSTSNPNMPGHTITPFIGSYADGRNPEQLISRQKFIKGGSFLTKGDSSLEVFEVIKNRSTFYSELRRLEKEMSDAIQVRVTECRTAITRAMAANGGQRPVGGGECANLPIPQPWFKVIF